jgi:hypothetical protein
MEGKTMKKVIMTAAFTLVLAVAPAMAQQMMGGVPGQHMAQQQQAVQQQQYNPQMMGGYGGYPMGQHMMGGYGYGMHPGMMGGYGYGMGPQMMGGYGGYPRGQHMMGGYGHGMHPGMMGGYGYGMGPQMMGGSGMPPCTQGSSYKTPEEYTKFLNDTKATRKKMHDLMFEYSEASRSPEPDRQKLEKMEKEMNELRTEIFNYKTK